MVKSNKKSTTKKQENKTRLTEKRVREITKEEIARDRAEWASHQSLMVLGVRADENRT